MKLWRLKKPAVFGLALMVAILLGVIQARAAAASFRFVVMGDSQGSILNSGINIDILDYINSEILKLEPKPAFVMFVGDLVEYGGTKNLRAWQDVMNPITEAGIKLYVVIGNHDLYDLLGKVRLANQAAFQTIFHAMPDNGPAGYEHLVYSFEYGNSFFAVLDTFYIDPNNLTSYLGEISDQQLAWLKAQISNTKAKHKFAFSHAPLYSVVHPAKQAESFHKLWKILDHHAFEMFFAGHEHLYSRWTIDNKVDRQWKHGVIQIITGGAGGRLIKKSQIQVDKTKTHIKLCNNFVVVDVEGNTIQEHAYGLRKTPEGKFTLINIDNYSLPR